ncbi:MAG: vWA domain-containing protein [Planctomycetaceae bacterium]
MHALLFLALACIVENTLVEGRLLLSSQISNAELIPPEDFKFDATAFDAIGNDGDLNSVSTALAATTHGSRSSQPRIEQQIKSSAVDVPHASQGEIFEPAESDVLAAVETTGATEHPGGVPGAIDRLTYEIAASLRERETLVIWLFDASLSLNARRSEIADRFENIYRQLGLLKVGGNGALKTAVVSFGQHTSILTKEPIDDVGEIVGAVREIEPDVSGKEYVFDAVQEAASRWKLYRTKEKRNVMAIIVTDERGDDFDRLEATIGGLKKLGIRVFCVGNEAIFGQEKHYVDFTDDRGFHWPRVPMDQGPETAGLERLRLRYWDQDDVEGLSSSYGPYALTRLCAETGGLYLVAEETGGPRFDPEVMREYTPDYLPVERYKRELEKNPAKAALVQAAIATSAEEIPRPQLRFRADTDTNLRQEINEAQKPLAVLDFRLKEMHALLDAGEKHRDRVKEPRWRAGYDLAMGRVLAMRVRAYGYNVVLAAMKTSPRPFEKQGNNLWILEPSTETDAPPQIVRMAERAVEYLQRVIAEHPGTPWQLLAQRELSAPMGWKWHEGYMEIPKPAPPAEPMPNRPRQETPRKILRPERGEMPKL